MAESSASTRARPAFDNLSDAPVSAEIVTQLVEKLVRYQPLTPLTYEPDEWNEVGDGMWQNKRKSSTFSDDGGKTHYDLNDDKTEEPT